MLQERLLNVIVAASAASLTTTAHEQSETCLAVCDLLGSCSSRRRFSDHAEQRATQLRIVAALLPAFEQQWHHALGRASPLHATAISRAFRKLMRLIADPSATVSSSSASCSTPVPLPEAALDWRERCCATVSEALYFVADTFPSVTTAPGAGATASAATDDDAKVDPRVDCARLLPLASAYRLWSPCTSSPGAAVRQRSTTPMPCGSDWFKDLSVKLLQAYASAGLSGLSFPKAGCFAPLLPRPPGQVAEGDLYSTRRTHFCPTATELGQSYRLVVVLHAAAALLSAADTSAADVLLVDKALTHLERHECGRLALSGFFGCSAQFLGAHVVDELLTSDDLLVEALLCLLTVHGCLKRWANMSESLLSENSERRLISVDPHRTFAHLVEKTGFNHHVLLDWLISPETKFLLYFVKYLKCLVNSVSASASAPLEAAAAASSGAGAARDKPAPSSGLAFLASSYSGGLSDDETGDSSVAPASQPTAGSVHPSRPHDVVLTGPSAGCRATSSDNKVPTAAMRMQGVAKVVGYGEALVLSRLEVALQGMHASGVFPYNASPLLRLLRELCLPSCLAVT